MDYSENEQNQNYFLPFAVAVVVNVMLKLTNDWRQLSLAIRLECGLMRRKTASYPERAIKIIVELAKL